MKLNGKAIQKALKSSEIDSEVHEGPEGIPFEEILVPLGLDPSGEEMVMQIGLLLSDSQESKLQFIQFLIMLPVRIEKPFIADTQSLIHLFNSVIELPGFGIIESERMPFFRYTMTCHNNEVDEQLFILTVGLILYIIDTYVETLQEVALGKKSYSEFLTDVQEV